MSRSSLSTSSSESATASATSLWCRDFVAVAPLVLRLSWGLRRFRGPHKPFPETDVEGKAFFCLWSVDRREALPRGRSHEGTTEPDQDGRLPRAPARGRRLETESADVEITGPHLDILRDVFQ